MSYCDTTLSVVNILRSQVVGHSAAHTTPPPWFRVLIAVSLLSSHTYFVSLLHSVMSPPVSCRSLTPSVTLTFPLRALWLANKVVSHLSSSQRYTGVNTHTHKPMRHTCPPRIDFPTTSSRTQSPSQMDCAPSFIPPILCLSSSSSPPTSPPSSLPLRSEKWLLQSCQPDKCPWNAEELPEKPGDLFKIWQKGMET